MTFSFDAGVALVAGGSGGIGAAITRALVQAGTDVAFTYNRNKEAADSLVAELASSGRRVECLQLALEDSAPWLRGSERSGRVTGAFTASSMRPVRLRPSALLEH
jgi:NAD(P)-dependent dehydrogenase (short-subunit alcohol dehydrogenase family)